MKRTTLFGLCALLVFGSARFAGARVVHISFDRAPDGSAIAGGTAVNTVYSALGVTFDAVRCPLCAADPNVYAVTNCRDYLPISPPNVISLSAENNCMQLTERLGLARATFAAPADSVCMLVMPVLQGERAVVHAFDAAGVEIATAYSTPSATGTFCVRARGMVRVEFSGAFLGHAWFDDFVVHMADVTPTLPRSWGALKSIYR